MHTWLVRAMPLLAQRTARKPCALCPSRDYAMTHVASACIRTLRQSTAVHNKYGFSATVCCVNQDPC